MTIMGIARKVKSHVKRNEVAYVAGTVAVMAIWLQQSNKNAFYKFLEEKGINPMEFHTPEAYAELKNINI